MEVNFELPHWMYWGGLLIVPVIFKVMLSRSAQALEEAKAISGGPNTEEITAAQIEEQKSDQDLLRERLTKDDKAINFFDSVSNFTGRFVAFWAPIAVVVYSWEVFARYFLNSPTNWAHESMFLLFGMMYLLSGAYGLLHGAHVRVDLFYAQLGQRGKAAIDIVTFPFMLAFIFALIWTGWTFTTQAMDKNIFFFAQGFNNEVSFTEWGIAYWPVKATLFFGGLFLLGAAISEFMKDLRVFSHLGPNGKR